MGAAITAGIGVLCLILAFIMWWLVPDFKFGPVVQVALLIAGSVGIAGSFFGGWVRSVVGWISGGINWAFGRFLGASVPFVLALILAAIVLFAFIKMVKEKDKTIGDASGLVGVSAFLLPLVATAIPGIVGAAINGGIAAISRGIGTVVAAAFGMR